MYRPMTADVTVTKVAEAAAPRTLMYLLLQHQKDTTTFHTTQHTYLRVDIDSCKALFQVVNESTEYIVVKCVIYHVH